MPYLQADASMCTITSSTSSEDDEHPLKGKNKRGKQNYKCGIRVEWINVNETKVAEEIVHLERLFARQIRINPAIQ